MTMNPILKKMVFSKDDKVQIIHAIEYIYKRS